MSGKEQFKIYTAAYLVLKKDNQVLLSKRANTGYQDGNYSLVAGHLDGGETVKDCIIREAQEEAGIILESNDLDVKHVLHCLMPDREYITIFLTANKWMGEIKNLEPEKCSELGWFPLDKLPPNMTPEVGLALKNITKGIFFDEQGWEK